MSRRPHRVAAGANHDSERVMRNEQHTTAGGRWAKFWDTLRRVLGALCI